MWCVRLIVWDSQLATSLPSDKVIFVRKNISAIKLPRCRPIKIWTRRGEYTYICTSRIISLAWRRKSRVLDVTYAMRYIFPCASALSRVCIYACGVRVQQGGKERGEMGIRKIQLSYQRILLAHYSDCRHHPRLSWLSRRVTWYSLHIFAARVRVDANRTRTCVRSACVRTFRASLTKSRVPYLCKCMMRMKKNEGGIAMIGDGHVTSLLEKID